MKVVINGVASAYSAIGIKTRLLIERYANSLMLLLGIVLLTGGLTQLSFAAESFTEANYNQTLIRNAVGNLFGLIEGAFGALIMVVAGLGAIVAAAMGAYRAAVGMLVVAVGAFILRALVSLFFGEDFETQYVNQGS